MKKRAHLFIKGVVQGVFFRGTAAMEARKNGLVGFAKNLMDESVEVVVEGEESGILKFIDWCHNGPAMARVDHVEQSWEQPTGEYPTFQTR
jgi:acylphosphatase